MCRTDIKLGWWFIRVFPCPHDPWTPAPPKAEWGYTGFTPDVCPSVSPSVRPSPCRKGSRNFLSKLLAQFIPYLACTLMGWVSWPLFIFVFLASFLALWWPNICVKMGFPEPFEKLLAQFISYLTFTLMGWVSWPLYIFVFLASFSAPWWPHIWSNIGFPELFAKTIGSIHYILGMYP